MPGVTSRAAGARAVPRGTVPRAQLRGLRLPPQLRYERWVEIGAELASLATSTAWCLGDWLVYGEAAFAGRYRDAVERSSLDYQTLRNYAWVTRRFPMSRRRAALSFSHHAEVAALPEPEQDFWLRKAEQMSWSRNRLRREVQASLRERGGTPDVPAEDEAGPAPGADAADPVTLRVRVPADLLGACQEVASVHGLSLEEWVLCTLKTTAHDALNQREAP